jgi:hypothetical protein
MLRGLLQLDGQALAQQRVLLISGDMTNFLGSTTTDDAGEFEINVPSDHRHGEVVLLVKIQGPVVALVHRAIDLEHDGSGPHEFSLETARDDFHSIEGKIVTTSGWPPYLTVFVDPVHVEGIPAPLEKFFRWKDERVIESTFFKMRLDGQVFDLKLLSGIYRIGANYLNYFLPSTENPDIENYVTRKLEADGESQTLPGEYYSGYMLDVKRDRQITLTIGVIRDEELNPSGS